MLGFRHKSVNFGAETGRYEEMQAWRTVLKLTCRLFGTNLSTFGRYEEMQAPRNALDLDGLNWLSGAPPPSLASSPNLEVLVKMRHGPHMHRATLDIAPGVPPLTLPLKPWTLDPEP
jgi:hypothetical protein